MKLLRDPNDHSDLAGVRIECSDGYTMVHSLIMQLASAKLRELFDPAQRSREDDMFHLFVDATSQSARIVLDLIYSDDDLVPHLVHAAEQGGL